MRGILVSAILILLIVSAFSAYGYEPGRVSLRARSAHDVIWVNNDTDLENLATAEGWPGDGSVANPYVIENYEIDAQGGGAAIYIGNVSKRIVIRNCTVYNATSVSAYGHAAGVEIYHTSYAFVYNLTAYDNMQYGVFVSKSNHVRVENSLFYGVNIQGYTAGICYVNSYYGVVANNIVKDSTHGIWMYFSYHAKLYNNTLTGTSIEVNGGYHADDYDIPENNTINDKPVIYVTGFRNNATLNAENAGEVILGIASYLTVTELNVDDVGCALLILGSKNITVHNVTIKNSTASSIYLHLSKNIRIEDTLIDNVSLRALHMEFSHGISVHNLTVLRSRAIQSVYGYSVTDFTISSSEISGGQDGIYLKFHDSENLTMENLFVHDFTRYGIWVDAATTSHYIENVWVSNSRVINNGYDAIRLWGVKHGNVSGNTVEGTGSNGINLGSFGEDIRVYGNKIEGMRTGVKLGSVFYCTVKGNEIYNSSNYGISLINARNNRIESNTINRTLIYGIYLGASSRDNIIIGNYIGNSTKYGLYIYSGVTGNLIYGNLFYFNHGSSDTYDSLHIQAYDGGSNEWNNTSMGNYWHDWAVNNDTNDQNGDGIVDWPYLIDGSSGSMDYYPLKDSGVYIPEISTIWLLMVLLAVIVLWKRP